MKTIILTFLLLVMSLPALASESYSIYLVRHAEKQQVKDNPSLTQCGHARAQQLAKILESAEIKKVYSTSYARTLETAMPLAKQNKVAVSHYSPRSLEQLVMKLKQAKENAVVVGHSNTTPQLASLLSEQPVGNITEKEYQMLYQIQFQQENRSLTVLKQPLTCH